MRDTMYGRKSGLSPKGAGLIFLLLGVVFLIVATILFTHDAKLRSVCTAETTATVIENVSVTSVSKSHSSSRTYAPIFEYEFEGIRHKIRSSTSQNPPKYEIGETVKLLVNPNEPITFRIDGDITLRIIAGIFAFFGIVFGSIAIIVIKKSDNKLDKLIAK